MKTLPNSKPRKTIPERNITMLLLLQGDEVLLEKRPPSGIWGGLWSLPEMVNDEDPQIMARERYGLETEVLPALPVLTHTFTHFRLHITPQPLRITKHLNLARQASMILLNREDAIGAALPTPIRKILLGVGKASESAYT